MTVLFVALLSLAATGQDAGAGPSEPLSRVRDVPIASVNIPDELAPAIVPFMNCLAASSGIPVLSDGRPVPPPPGISRGSDCTASRQEAQEQGDRILQRLGVQDAEQRRARVEAALGSAESFASISRNPPPPPHLVNPEAKASRAPK